MSSSLLILLIVAALALLGSATLIFITVKYYWGDRGRPPLTGAERAEQRERELQMRARQIELSREKPFLPRSESFLDNRKR